MTNTDDFTGPNADTPEIEADEAAAASTTDDSTTDPDNGQG